MDVVRPRRKPVFVELAGLPVAGKTTTATLLVAALTELGRSCALVPEAAADSPLADFKREPLFNLWTMCATLMKIMERDAAADRDVIVVDRGLVDALCWIEWHRARGSLASDEAQLYSSFVQSDRWFGRLRHVVILNASLATSRRRLGTEGRIVNAETFAGLKTAYATVLGQLSRGSDGATIQVLGTDSLAPHEVLDRVLAGLPETVTRTQGRRSVPAEEAAETYREALLAYDQVLRRTPGSLFAREGRRQVLRSLESLGMLQSSTEGRSGRHATRRTDT